MPTAVASSTTATTISLSWSVPSGSVVDSYVVEWERGSSENCPYEDAGNATITDGSTSYSIAGLEEDSSYTITVTATNVFGSVVSDAVTGVTGERGLMLLICSEYRWSQVNSFLQFHLPLPLLSAYLVQAPPASLSSGEQWTASTAMGT